VVRTAALGISLVTLAAGLFLCNTGRSDSFAVVPAEYANTTAPGNGEIGEAINGSSSGETLQYVIPASYLTGLSGQSLTGLGFRLNNNYAPNLPQIDYSEYNIQLSLFSGSSLSSTFADNLVDPVTVRSGAFSFVAGAFPTGAQPGSTTPNGFGNFISFQTPFDYASGNLLVTIQHSQPQLSDPEVSYWSVDAYDSGFNPTIGHDDTATSGLTYWPDSPITEFTTAALNVDGTVVPEPSTFVLGGAGLLGLLVFRRRNARD
jgi:hypothetical protein